jgi:hypothetical protein
LTRLLTPPRPPTPAPPASLPDLVAISHLVGELPPAVAEPLLALLIDLRAQGIGTTELWRRWDALPVDPPRQLQLLRTFLESWLYWRDHGMQFGPMPSATEHPDRTLYRTWLDHLIGRLETVYRPSEVAATRAPDGRGDELAAAEREQ